MQQLTGPVRMPRNGKPRSAVVLLHGYGADGHDLISLADYWCRDMPETVFLAPHASEPLPFPGMGGRQWFPLTLRDPREYWHGVSEAAPALDAFLDGVLDTYGLSAEHLALAGFSQGCMMALHVGLRRRTPLAAILGMSGLLAGPEKLLAELTSPTPIELIHGSADDVIPVHAMHAAGEALAAAGLTVKCHECQGLGHGIDEAGLRLGGTFLKHHLSAAQNTL